MPHPALSKLEIVQAYESIVWRGRFFSGLARLPRRAKPQVVTPPQDRVRLNAGIVKAAYLR
jgi:hypothetical protein